MVHRCAAFCKGDLHRGRTSRCSRLDLKGQYHQGADRGHVALCFTVFKHRHEGIVRHVFRVSSGTADQIGNLGFFLQGQYIFIVFHLDAKGYHARVLGDADGHVHRVSGLTGDLFGLNDQRIAFCAGKNANRKGRQAHHHRQQKRQHSFRFLHSYVSSISGVTGAGIRSSRPDGVGSEPHPRW